MVDIARILLYNNKTKFNISVVIFIVYYTIGTDDLKCADYFSCDRYHDVFCMPHVHYSIEFVFVVDGVLNVKLGNTDYVVNKNELIGIMPYDVHEFRTDGNSDIIVFVFSPKLVSEYVSFLSDKCFIKPIACLSENFREFILENILMENSSIIEKKSILYTLLTTLVKNDNLKERPNVKYDICTNAILYIDKNFKEDISLEEVAHNLGVHSVHLSRSFHKNTGLTFNELVNFMRLKESYHLLINSQASISEVAYESGFGSIRNFNRVFLKYFHQSPKSMRQSRK